MEKKMAKKRETLAKELTVTFDYAVSIKGSEVTELTIRKPKIKDMRNMDKYSGDEMDKEIWMLSNLTRASISDLENLDKDQYELIQEAWGKYAVSRFVII